MSRARITDPYDPRYPHGKKLGYSRRCRCDGCRHANHKHDVMRQLADARGAGPRVPAAKVRAHVRALLAHPDITYAALSRASGCGPDTIRRLMTENSTGRCERRVADALLAVTKQSALAAVSEVPAEPARVLLRRLQAHGWPLRELAARVGQASQPAPTFLYRKTVPVITAAMWAKVQAVYAELQDKPGPSDTARKAARRLGYYPPACYDDDGTLDPTAIPTDLTPSRARKTDKKMLSPERLAMMRLDTLRLTLEDRLPPSEIGVQLRANPDAVSGWRTDLGLRWQFEAGVVEPRPGQAWEVRACRRALAAYGSGAPAEQVWANLAAHLKQYRTALDMAAAVEAGWVAPAAA